MLWAISGISAAPNAPAKIPKVEGTNFRLDDE
jgi:hypothetical protein